MVLHAEIMAPHALMVVVVVIAWAVVKELQQVVGNKLKGRVCKINNTCTTKFLYLL